MGLLALRFLLHSAGVVVLAVIPAHIRVGLPEQQPCRMLQLLADHTVFSSHG
jgi:hypothetical protein